MKTSNYTYSKVLEMTANYFNGDEFAAKVFADKYALQTPNGEFLELTPEAMHRRLSKEFARIEQKYPNPLSEEEVFSLLDKFRYIVPQGSPMSGIGNPYQLQSLSNCFVIQGVYSDKLDSYGGIMLADQELAQIMKRRGGCGLDISGIRPKNALTNNAAKTTDGIAVFMERFSNTCREVAQNGRRGAEMITISINHPEIETFINIKRDLKKVTGANISIKMNDEFMYAVKNDQEYTLRWPVDVSVDNAKITKVVRAKDIWDQVIDSAWTSAEPGILFWDNVQKNTPADIYEDYKSISTNPSLRGDTLVATYDGVYNIQYLAENNPDNMVLNILGEWHPCKVFKSGINKQLYKITFTNGQEVFCTPEHKWPILNSSNNIINKFGKIKKVATSDLRRRHKIYFPSFKNPIYNKNCKFSNQDGFILGWLSGDGWESYHKTNKTKQYGFVFSNEDIEFGIGKRVLDYTNSIAIKKSSLRKDHDSQAMTYCTTDKNVINKLTNLGATNKSNGIPKTIWTSNHDFITGYIDGLFSADAYIEVKKRLSKCRIVLVSSHEKLVNDVRKLLNFYGIRSYIQHSEKESSFPNGKCYNKKYNRYDLSISGKDAAKFSNIFKLSNLNKNLKLNNIFSIENIDTSYKNERNYLVIKSVEKTDLYEDVYDITVFDDTHTFLMESGITGNCGEIVLSAYDACRLLVLNLTSYVENPFTRDACFDFDLFNKHTIIAQRLMDDIIDLEIEFIDKILDKVARDPEPEEVKFVEVNLWNKIKKANQEGRRTGLGITGLGDALAMLGIKYGSRASINKTQEIYRALAVGAHTSSCIMAKERGAFSCFDYDKEKDHEYLLSIMNDAPEWVMDIWKEYGRRNIALTTTAPTGSVSTLTQTTSGIEPAYSLSYIRRKKINPSDKDARVDFVDDMGDQWQEFTIYHHGLKKWMEVTGKDKIEDSPYWGATATEIDWVASVDLQAAAQKSIDHSISKTCNLPKDVSKEVVSDVYMRAWTAGCKGFTVYRDGCRTGILVTESKKEEKDEDGRPLNIVYMPAPKRPLELPCHIKKSKIQGEGWTIFVSLLNGAPYEIFGGLSKYIDIPNKYKEGKIAKNGRNADGVTAYNLVVGEGDDQMIIKDIANVFENKNYGALTRTISLAIRHGAPIQFVVEQLGKDKFSDMTSFSKVIARVLKKYIKDGTAPSGEKVCCNCNSSGTLVYYEGCVMCSSCGWRKCD